MEIFSAKFKVNLATICQKFIEVNKNFCPTKRWPKLLKQNFFHFMNQNPYEKNYFFRQFHINSSSQTKIIEVKKNFCLTKRWPELLEKKISFFKPKFLLQGIKIFSTNFWWILQQFISNLLNWKKVPVRLNVDFDYWN